jgi:retron-type reverse transcriptase
MMPPLFSFKNLYRQYLRCRRQKRITHNALRFEANLEEHLVRLREELDGRTYHPSRSVCFVVKHPKFREIFAADFRDRVVHHVLVEVLERIWEPLFLHDSYACRKGKGTHRAVTRLQQFMRRVTHNGTKPGYALQLDIRGFFFHIDKEILFQIVAKRIRDETLLWLARTIIFHDCTEQAVFKTDRRLWRHIPPHKTLFGTENRRGLPIGNLTSQFFSNVYLNELDQFVKHQLKAQHYLRYSDDFVLVHEDPAQLLAWQEQIQTFLAERLRLTLTDPSAKPHPIRNGVDFLGYIVRPDYLLVRRRVVSRLKTTVRRHEAALVDRTPRYTLYRYDKVRLDQLRAAWASYPDFTNSPYSSELTH